ncbi:MAG: TolC family protein [Saprospiraceae bacterium]
MTYKHLYITVFSIISLMWSQRSAAQYSIQQALQETRTSAPIFQLMEISNEELQLKERNINAQNLPHISLNGRATYQSDVTSLGISLPGVEIKPISKDQYKITADVYQNIYSGGTIKQSALLAKTVINLENINTEIELEKIRYQIIQLYFSVLEIDTKKEILTTRKQSLESNLKKLITAVNLGALLKSESNALKAAIIQIKGQIIELKATRSNVIQNIKLLTKSDLTEDIKFEIPKNISLNTNTTLHNLNIKQFEIQNQLIDQKHNLSLLNSKPKVGIFLQGGYGKPGLNFLKDGFDLFAIGGLQLKWDFGNLYTKANDLQLNTLQKQKVGLKKEAVQLKNEIVFSKENIEIEKLKSLLIQDQQLIEIRAEITKTAKSKMENGTITSSEYINRFNEETIAKENLKLREIKLLKAMYQLQHLSGNYSIN